MGNPSTAARTRQPPRVPPQPHELPRARQQSRSRGVWADRITGRFRKITVHQIALAWWCHQAGHITRRQLRIYFAAHEMAERRSYTDPINGPERPLYTLGELKCLVGGRGSKTADAELRVDLRHLARLGLVSVKRHRITFAVSIDQLALDDITGFWTMFNQLPHPRRSVPVPRRMVRAIAGGLSRGAVAVALATLIRSLFWNKIENGYRTDGRTKRQWITDVFGVSARTVTDGRAKLIELGWLVPLDTPQHLRNRWGSHDAINVDWAANDQGSSGGRGGSGGDPHKVIAHEITPETRGGRGGGGGESASPSADFSGGSASPDLNSSSPLTGNLDTRRPAPMRAGPAGASLRSALGSRKKKICRTTPTNTPTKPSAPNIRDIRPEDLRDTERLLELHRQAVARGLASPSESGKLDFIALAERARCSGAKPAALFFYLLREHKTHFITIAQEDEASRRLKEHNHGPARPPQPPRAPQDRQQWGGRGGDGGRGGEPAPQPKPVELSDDDRFIQACVSLGKKCRRDPFDMARAKGWTRDRWDEALFGFEQKMRSAWAPVQEDES